MTNQEYKHGWYLKHRRLTIARSARWRKDNWARYTQLRRAWEKKNKILIRLRARRWRITHPNARIEEYKRHRISIIARSKAWYMKNKTKAKKRISKWQRDNPERHKYNELNSHLKRKFGITAEQFNKLMILQGGVCAICGHPPKTRRLHVDHAHDKSKRVRALLCYRCNVGRMGENTVETARKVLSILESTFDARML